MQKRSDFSARVGRIFKADEMTEVTVLYGDHRAVIRGCKRILSYSPTEIQIALGRHIVCLEGMGLRCVSFAAGSTAVEGVLHSVTLQTIAKKEGHA